MYNAGIQELDLKEIIRKVSNLLKKRYKKKFWNENCYIYIEIRC